MGYTDKTDNELLKRLSEGDHVAFRIIYEKYWERLFRSAYSILRDVDQSNDILQDIFVSLWDKRETTSIDNLPAYLYRSVKFQIANLIRHKKIRESFFEEVQALADRMDRGGVSNLGELQGVIERGIESLPEKCREIFIMSRKQNLTHKEIAERLGISPRTVENQIVIALKKLRISAKDYLVVEMLALLAYIANYQIN